MLTVESSQVDSAGPTQAALPKLSRLIDDRTARVAVIGMGYVGLPLAHAFWKGGLTVDGLDIDQSKVVRLNRGESYISHVADSEVASMRESGRFAAIGAFDRLSEADAILICVPTPLGGHREPDLSMVESTAHEVSTRLRPGQLVVLESTSYPGTTQDLVRPILELSGLVAGQDFYLAYSPEREDPGNPDYSTAGIPKVVGADDATARELAGALYGVAVDQVVPVTNTKTAEAVKLTENVFRAVNIALVNELKQIYAAMDIDVWEVIEAAKSKPFGYMPFYPGPGLGGHCIPIDPFYLSWCARGHGVPTRFIELAGEINTAMPAYVVERLIDALNRRAGIAPKFASVLVIGAAYKKDVSDCRESPALNIMRRLNECGVTVDYHDPHIPEIPDNRQCQDLIGQRSVSLEHTAVSTYDAVLICTDHDAVDYGLIGRAARLVVDTRNAMVQHGADLGNTVNV